MTTPLLVATTATLLGYSLIGITPFPFRTLLAISVVGALSAPLLALVPATAAPNKVGGLAVVKVLNGVNLLPIAAFFLPTPLQYAAGVIPTYWPMRAFSSAAAGEGYSSCLVIGATSCALALLLAAFMFELASCVHVRAATGAARMTASQRVFIFNLLKNRPMVRPMGAGTLYAQLCIPWN